MIERFPFPPMHCYCRQLIELASLPDFRWLSKCRLLHSTKRAARHPNANRAIIDHHSRTSSSNRSTGVALKCAECSDCEPLGEGTLCRSLVQRSRIKFIECSHSGCFLYTKRLFALLCLARSSREDHLSSMVIVQLKL